MLKIEKYKFTDTLIEEMKALCTKSAKYDIEYGFNLYANFRDIYLLESGVICTGDNCEVKIEDKLRKTLGHIPIGDFHTHMTNELQKAPYEDMSLEDLYNILTHQIKCVGFNHNKLACYIVNIINNDTYIQALRNDSKIINEYTSKLYEPRITNIDITLKENFEDAWDRLFNIYLSIYYIDLNSQKIES